LPDRYAFLDKIKPVVIVLILVVLAVASFLSFISMCFIVTLLFIPEIAYFSPIMMPLFIAIFIFLSQLIPGYFAQNKKQMLINLVLITIIMGILFSLLNIVKGVIYAASCLIGHWFGFYIREKHAG